MIKLENLFNFGKRKKDDEVSSAPLKKEGAVFNTEEEKKTKTDANEEFFEGGRDSLEGGILEQIEKAKEILGEREVLGPEKVEKTFGASLEMKAIPSIPFGKDDLERAKELGQFLVLRSGKDKNGDRLSLKKMLQIFSEEFKLDPDADWCEEEEFFTKDSPELYWALSSKEIISDSNGKNYLEQTGAVINYLKEEVFKDRNLPQEYREAIEEFAENETEIKEIMKDDWRKAAKRLEELKITRLTRQTPTEFMYDVLVYFKNNREILFNNIQAWTSRRCSSGQFVSIGGPNVQVHGFAPSYSHPRIGVAFSRSI